MRAVASHSSCFRANTDVIEMVLVTLYSLSVLVCCQPQTVGLWDIMNYGAGHVSTEELRLRMMLMTNTDGKHFYVVCLYEVYSDVVVRLNDRRKLLPGMH